MDAAGLSGSELLRWNDSTFVKWMDFAEREPRMMDVPCDVYGVSDLRGLLHHVVVVELRYAQRLCGEAETAYEDVGADLASLIRTHDGMKTRMKALLADASFDWEAVVDFRTRSMGVLRASRRTVFVHTMMHSIRHYAQAATIARAAGYAPGWPMDYLFMGVVGRAD